MPSVKEVVSFVGVGVSCIKLEHRKTVIIAFRNYFYDNKMIK